MKADDIRVSHAEAEELFEKAVQRCEVPVYDLEDAIRETMNRGLYKMSYRRPMDGPKDVALAAANRWLRNWKSDFFVIRASVSEQESGELLFALDLSWSWASKFLLWTKDNPDGGFWEGELSVEELTDLQKQNWMFVPEGIGYTVTRATAVDPVLELHKQND